MEPISTTVAAVSLGAITAAAYFWRARQLRQKLQSRSFVSFKGQQFQYLTRAQICHFCFVAAADHRDWRLTMVWHNDSGFEAIAGLNEVPEEIFLRCRVKPQGKLSEMLYEWSAGSAAMQSSASAEWQSVEKFITVAERWLANAELKMSFSDYRLGGTRVYKSFAFSRAADIVKSVLANAVSAADDHGKIISFKADESKQSEWTDLIETDIGVEGGNKFHLRFYSQDQSMDEIKAWELRCDWKGSNAAMSHAWSAEWEIVRGLFHLIDKNMLKAGAEACFPSSHYTQVLKLGFFRAAENSDYKSLKRSCLDLVRPDSDGHIVYLPPPVKVTGEQLPRKHVPGASELRICYQTDSGSRKFDLCIEFIPFPPESGVLMLAWSGTRQQMGDSQSIAWKLIGAFENMLKSQLLKQGAVALNSLPIMRINFLEKSKKISVAHPVRVFWPTPQDYNEAVQLPALCFSDPDLKSGSVLLNDLGLPRATSGAFASVYKLSAGQNDWAVRCFTAPVKDQLMRYEKTSRFICSDDLPYTVSCEFLESGLRVADKWFPLVKMEWVEGTPLNTFIAQILDDKPAVEALRAKFAQMMRDLHRNGIAHGDLQHGNIIIRNGEFVLVDYDNMFVPELAGCISLEKGHRNYQHPYRNAKHFGPYLDYFSAWVIDTALMCLERQPELWQRFGAGDESLLFFAKDYLDPEHSELFRLLLAHPDKELSERAQRLESFLAAELPELPPLG